MPINTKDPGAWGCVGASKTERLDAGPKPPDSTERAEIESYAAEFVARRYRLAPSVARLVCRLARLGEVYL